MDQHTLSAADLQSHAADELAHLKTQAQARMASALRNADLAIAMAGAIDHLVEKAAAVLLLRGLCLRMGARAEAEAIDQLWHRCSSDMVRMAFDCRLHAVGLATAPAAPVAPAMAGAVQPLTTRVQ